MTKCNKCKQKIEGLAAYRNAKPLCQYCAEIIRFQGDLKKPINWWVMRKKALKKLEKANLGGLKSR